jgi:UTP pyrophosphatase
MKYLAHYPQELQDQVRALLEEDRLEALLRRRYPATHTVRSDKALYAYVSGIKGEFLRSSEPLDKVLWDNTLHPVRHALGTHTTVSRVQGGRLKAKREIRVATLFRDGPPEFLRMIVVHELAHFREREHDKAFYALCTRMEPKYHQLEFDLRMALTYMELHGKIAWGAEGDSASGP